MSGAGGTGAGKRRGRGGCCGCLILLLLLLGGSLWLARKWAPNHLNRGLAWSRGQLVLKYPALSRWLPAAPGAQPATVFEPTAPPSASPTSGSLATPMPSPSPASAELTPAGSAPGTEAPKDLLVGAGAEAQLGQTLVVHYGGTKPADLPEQVMLGAGDVSEPLEQALRGMRVGGKRQLGALEIELVKIL